MAGMAGMAVAGHFLPLSHGQTMYYEVHGNRKGPVALVLHGGPGAGLSPLSVQMFDLTRWCVILYDQRGCGRSKPFGVPSLSHNTTDDLLDDMERLRRVLRVKKWYLTGGSWGSTLALVYAEKYPYRVSGLLLRALCLMDDTESAWLYERHGAAQIFPEEYKRFLAPLTASERAGTMLEILRAYQRRLTSPDKKIATEAAAAWTGYEDAVISLVPKPVTFKGKKDISVAILENHYFINTGFLKPGQILADAHRLRRIPIDVIHGRYDMICPYRSVAELSKILPQMKVKRVEDGGHSGYFKEEIGYIRKVTDAFVKGVPRSKGTLKAVRMANLSKLKTRKRSRE
jgi:proline iminopeptidase